MNSERMRNIIATAYIAMVLIMLCMFNTFIIEAIVADDWSFIREHLAGFPNIGRAVIFALLIIVPIVVRSTNHAIARWTIFIITAIWTVMWTMGLFEVRPLARILLYIINEAIIIYTAVVAFLWARKGQTE